MDPGPSFVRAPVDAWRSATPQSQWSVAGTLLALIAVSFTISLIDRQWMPLTAYFVWLMLGALLLRFRPLVVVAAVDMGAGVGSLVIKDAIDPLRVAAICWFVIAVALVLFVASRQHSGLPATLSESFLNDLKQRLQSQGRIPHLPYGWQSQSAMLASHSVAYAGDFVVADLSDDGRRLEVILVDLCGKGVHAAPAALQFAGALGGLIGVLAPRELFGAANDFLIRQHDDEALATAVHLLVDLETGSYEILSAGHPPALRWDVPRSEWIVENARGTALGVVPDPELQASAGRLFQGEALLFYTDGVVEGRHHHIDAGIEWLQRTALEAVGVGFPGAADRIIAQVETGADDRAVLMITRGATVGARAHLPQTSNSAP